MKRNYFRKYLTNHFQNSLIIHYNCFTLMNSGDLK